MFLEMVAGAVFQTDSGGIQISMWFRAPDTCGNAFLARALNVPSNV